ncbi:hypothetical protein [Bacillus solitudinis]|uniref:hypothetical protein n=1 Tax=Bacillus solitudinis TaxID=2014074 RepID=UPI000C237F16|nr:hypothetical protein [Bacillus solitudinis]
MVTVVFSLVFIGLALLMSVLDAFVYQQSFIQSVLQLISIEAGTRRIIVLFTAIAGFATSVITDIKLSKKKSKQQEVT